jgi:hypothetical protein
VRVDVVVGLGQDPGDGERRRVAEDAGALSIEGLRGGVARGRGLEREEGVFVGEGAGAPFLGSEGGGYVGGRGVAKNEEFDEGADEDDDGELAKEEALSEGESR